MVKNTRSSGLEVLKGHGRLSLSIYALTNQSVRQASRPGLLFLFSRLVLDRRSEPSPLQQLQPGGPGAFPMGTKGLAWRASGPVDARYRLEAYANRHRFATREQLEQQQASIEELIKGLLKEAEAADQGHQGEGEPAELLPEFANEQEKVAAIKAVLERAEQREVSKKSKGTLGPSAVGAATPARYGLISPIQTVGSCTVKALGRWLVLTPRSRSMCKGRV